MKTALITGITGQDGSYLADFLLERGYKVVGMIRRLSSPNLDRIEHIKDKVELAQGDLHDQSSIMAALKDFEPDEVYNLAAQSFVPTSWSQPVLTGEVTALGVTRVLEAIRNINKDIKFYQASSSEMFGEVQEVPQKETTRFHPRSPYGVAKVYGYWITVNYRESYGIFACNGILFNHETIASFTPMFCKNKNEESFDIKPIREIVRFDETNKKYQSKKVSGIQVWDKEGWVDVTFASAYPHKVKEDNKEPRFINSRSGAFMATGNHVVFMGGFKEKEVRDIKVGDCLEIITLPKPQKVLNSSISENEAELAGMIVGDGSINYSKKGIGVHGKFTNSSEEIRRKFSKLWSSVTGGKTVYFSSKSGFNPEKEVGQLILVGGNDWLRKIDIYNNDRTKRVPKAILNSSQNIMLAFLRGYNITDGLKENSCVYEFRNFKTNSATLAMGLWYLIDKTTKQDVNLTLEMKDDGRLFYSLNILTTTDNLVKEEKVKKMMAKKISQREISRKTSISRDFIRKVQRGGSACIIHHLKKNPLEVKKIIDLPEYNGWFYDLETTSGKFHCGVGKCVVHNSPRRGLEFVTRKITDAAVRIKLGMADELRLGNLDSKRDWGFAGDYVKSMWMMMQHEKPDDYVICTEENHSVREFCDVAFRRLGLNYEDYVKVDQKFYRPAEVKALIGDCSKAKQVLGWKPEVSFKQLVEMMVDADMERLKK